MATMRTRALPGPGWHAKHMFLCFMTAGMWAPFYWLAYRVATRVRAVTTTD
jgi:hypothetical protein